MKLYQTTSKNCSAGLLAVTLGLLSISPARAQINSVTGYTSTWLFYNDNSTTYQSSTFSPSATLLWNQANAGATSQATFSLSNLSNGGLDVSLASIDSVNALTTTSDGGNGSQEYGYARFTLTAPMYYTFSGSYSDIATYPEQNGAVDGQLYSIGGGGAIFGYYMNNPYPGANIPNPFSETGILAPGTYSYECQISLAYTDSRPSDNYYPAESDNGLIDLQLTPAPEPSTWVILLGGFGLLAFWRARQASKGLGAQY
jgi:PEP-CTERM motif